MLNPRQQEAVNYTEGPLLVLAGAGTGKTRVLTHRIAYIIENKLAEPQNILAVTFTNKAAREMQERINNIIHAEGLNVGTFHSIATKILRSHANKLEIKIDSRFIIIDQDDQIKLVKNVALEQNADIKQYPPKAIHSIISRWKDQGLLPQSISQSDIISPIYGIAKHIYTEYQNRMHNSNSLDFGDLLLYCNQLLIKNPELLEYYQNKFRYILIDEYQDTNAVQYVWMRMLASEHKNICCVGDDDQSIYSWRGAEVKNILRFENDFVDAKIIKLEQNYRSTPYILEAATQIISHNKNRHDKKLWTEQKTGEKIKIISCWSDKEEARFIVTQIMKMSNSGKYKASQIAVLVRAGFQTRVFEEMFISNALPYQIIGGLRFYERMEIRDVLAYIRLSINNNDNLALERIINVPKRSIGNVTLRKIKEFASEKEISLFSAVKIMLSESELKGKVKLALQQFVELISEASNRYQNESASKVTKFILEESGYLSLYKQEKTDEARARLENINEMLRAIEEFDDILEFVEHSSLVMDNDLLESDFGGTIKIMTLHAAKGLEFDLVFLPGWEENIFPHQKSLNEEGKKGLEEERRIAYVGITRARREVYITYAESRRLFAEFINSIPSRFIKEISADLCIVDSSNNQLNYLGSRHNFSMQPNEPVKAKINANTKSPGQRISHEKFGQGIIVRRNGDSLEIAFEKIGIKTIKESFVSLIN
ncbi:MAG TPA: UvrD-helicase domain-containing protein [Candidatus Megaira endosymbiont of Nemacystus decipiens]|nr:UvrD-helicase domain-containing protein [Candidatus Megaera endosymbiont of Nemacystus decipiens]